ncbi:hypothetical protein [Rhizobium leguminosarum]|uniref:hypothetical protein n=1 Tax=Rhizobium leguminosarum TaxID=384 RepID=UPI001FDFE0BB|nr:hypothetical protein [Rhizobium leguminosarum]
MVLKSKAGIMLIVAIAAACQARAEDSLLVHALTCELPSGEVKNLPADLEASVPGFAAPKKEFALPSMNLYSLEKPISAFGYTSSEVLIQPGRILLAISGTNLDAVIKSQELTVADIDILPALKQVGLNTAIIAFRSGQEDLASKVLLGCEYRMPEAAWPIGGSVDDVMKLAQ